MHDDTVVSKIMATHLSAPIASYLSVQLAGSTLQHSWLAFLEYLLCKEIPEILKSYSAMEFTDLVAVCVPKCFFLTSLTLQQQQQLHDCISGLGDVVELKSYNNTSHEN